jgi:hypothetical protein
MVGGSNSPGQTGTAIPDTIFGPIPGPSRGGQNGTRNEAALLPRRRQARSCEVRKEGSHGAHPELPDAASEEEPDRYRLRSERLVRSLASRCVTGVFARCGTLSPAAGFFLFGPAARRVEPFSEDLMLSARRGATFAHAEAILGRRSFFGGLFFDDFAPNAELWGPYRGQKYRASSPRVACFGTRRDSVAGGE